MSDDDLMTAYMVGYHKRDDEVAALKAEIERLRGLLREGITKHDALTVVYSEPALWHYWKRVSEALEK